MMKRPLLMAVLLLIASFTAVRYATDWKILCLAAFFVVGVLWLIVARKRNLRRFWWFMGFLLVFGFLYGDFRITEPAAFPVKESETCVIRGEVISRPEKNGDHLSFLFRTDHVSNIVGSYDLYCSVPAEGASSSVEAGDLLEMTGVVAASTLAGNPGVFSFSEYLEDLSVSAMFSAEDEESVAHIGRRFHPLQSTFGWLRGRFLAAADYLTEDGAALVRGIFLGDTSSLSQSTLDVLTKTGIRHCFAVSGLHVGYVILIVLLPCSMLGVDPRKRWLLLLPFLVVYCGITDFQPSVVRASVMALVMLAVYGFGRQFDPYSSLSFAALVLLLWDPANLWLAGFQLSFCAVLSIFLFQKFFRKLLPQKGPEALWDAVAVTFAAQVGIIPLIAYYFHVVSVISFLLSPVVCVIVGGIVILSVVALVFSVILPLLGAVLLFSAEFLAWVAMGIASLTSILPGAYFSCPSLPLLWVALMECALLSVRFLSWFRYRRKIALGVIAAVFAVLLVPFSPLNRNGDFTVTFLSVGNGDCIHIHTPDQRNLLIDAAGRYGDSTAVNVIRPYLLSQGISTLDGIFCTHGDADHSGGIPYLISFFPTDTLYIAEAAADSYGDLPAQALKEGLSVISLERGDTVPLFDGAALEVLSPEAEDYGSDNELSLVMRLTFGETTVLFTGDVEQYGIAALLERYGEVSADIMQLPHHGSKTGLSLDFYHNVSPEAVVVSASQRSDVFPNREVAGYWRQAGIPLYRTGEDGAVTFTLKEDGWDVSCYLKDGTERRRMERLIFHNSE